MATGSPLSLFFSVFNKPSLLALHTPVSPCMCSCPVWCSSTELTGFSFSMELKAGHGIQVLWAYMCWTEWEIIISSDLLALLLLTQPSMKLAPTGGIIFNLLLIRTPRLSSCKADFYPGLSPTCSDIWSYSDPGAWLHFCYWNVCGSSWSILKACWCPSVAALSSFLQAVFFIAFF